MATRIARSVLANDPIATSAKTSFLLSRSFSASSTYVSSLSFPVFRTVRPVFSALNHLLNVSSAISERCFSTRQATSSLNDPNPNWSNRPPKETILLDGCDFEHWLVVMEPPEGEPTRDEIIDSYIKTLAMIVGSEQEARMKIYSVSTRCYFAFGALVSEELSYKIKELPRVRWVLPDSYLDVKNKDYGGEPFIDGEAVPYDPKYHEEWIRNNAKAQERNRRNNSRPRNADRPRSSLRRRENMPYQDFRTPMHTNQTPQAPVSNLTGMPHNASGYRSPPSPMGPNNSPFSMGQPGAPSPPPNNVSYNVTSLPSPPPPPPLSPNNIGRPYNMGGTAGPFPPHSPVGGVSGLSSPPQGGMPTRPQPPPQHSNTTRPPSPSGSMGAMPQPPRPPTPQLPRHMGTMQSMISPPCSMGGTLPSRPQLSPLLPDQVGGMQSPTPSPGRMGGTPLPLSPSPGSSGHVSQPRSPPPRPLHNYLSGMQSIPLPECSMGSIQMPQLPSHTGGVPLPSNFGMPPNSYQNMKGMQQSEGRILSDEESYDYQHGNVNQCSEQH